MNQIDARGFSCPEPVLMTKRAIQEKGTPLTVLVDNEAPLQNIMRFAANAGHSFAYQAMGEDYEITIT